MKMKRILFTALALIIVELSFGQGVFGTLVANKPSGGTLALGTSSLFNVSQTTSAQTITVPAPSGSIYTIEVANVGIVPFTLSPGGSLDTGRFMRLRWVGTGSGSGSITNKWVYAGGGSTSGGSITGVTAGTWLTGGGSSGNVPLNVDSSKVASNTDLANGLATKQNTITVLPLANGGTGASSAGLTGLNNILGTNLLGTTGSTSSSLVFSVSPNFTTPNLGSPVGFLANCTGYNADNVVFIDNTTNNASTSMHGFAPKLPNDVTKFLNGIGTYTVPAAGGSGTMTSLTPGFGLSGTSNPITTSGTLSIDSSKTATKTSVTNGLALKVTANANITGATKTKITFGINGLVTAGADATTADIAASTNKNYVTDAQQTVIGNTSGTNTGDQTAVTGNAGTATALQTARNIDGVSFNGTANITVIAPATDASTSKTTPVDADELPLVNSASSNVLAKLTWANLKATLNTYFATLFQPINSQSTISASAVDWTFTHLYKTLGANTTFTFSNAADGKTIVIAITNTASNYTVTWPTVDWGSAGAPVQRVGAVTDIYTFVRINGTIYGSARQ
jgi:hypothetical protein